MSITAQVEHAENIARGLKALAKVQQQEIEKKSCGYRYVTLSNRTRVLVECDSNGNPTKRGQRQINSLKGCLV
jgi:hypothetical protein